MSSRRRLLSAVAALLAVLVAIQATDLIACADGERATRGVHTDAGIVQGAHAMPASGDSHDGTHHDEEAPDCLCHVVFTPTAVIPSAEPLRAPEPAEFGAYVTTPTEAELMGLDHVPLT